MTTAPPSPTIARVTLASGQVLGSYRIVRHIADGGMGAVYEATHVVLDKRVALKTLIASGPADAEMAARFVEEGRAASRLRHPNVVDVTDIGVHEGTPYLVMELLDGETLASAIARDGAMPVERAIDLALPIIDALALAHDAGIVHRDLKPQNVFLVAGRTGTQPKVVDFGISRVVRPGVARLTQSAALMGTPCYMAPEQVRDARSVDARSDVFSLALVVYEMLVGARAVRGESLIEVLHAITSGEIVPLGRANERLPAELVGVLERAYAVDPAKRTESMRELGTALAPFASRSARGTWEQAVDAREPAHLEHARVEPLAPTAVQPGSARSVGDVVSRFRSTTLACPPLAVIDHGESSWWLGATAAHAIARRARWLLGGATERVLPPLVLARTPSDSAARYVASPFDEAATLDTANIAAANAGSVLRGSVELRRGRVFLRAHIELAKECVASAEVEGASLAAAARDAVLRLGDALGWAPLADAAREAYGEIDSRAGVRLEDVFATTGDDPDAEIDEATLSGLGCIARSIAIEAGVAPAEVDVASAASRAWTARAFAARGGALSPELSRALKKDIDAAKSLEAQATFRALAAHRATQAGDAEQAWSLALRATALDPRSTLAWDALVRATPRERMTQEHAWRVMTWAPDSQTIIPPENDAERLWGLTITRRALMLHPTNEVVAFHVGAFLVRGNDLTGAESFAAEMDDASGMRVAAEGTRALVDLHQARFGRALHRFRDLVVEDETRRFGTGMDGGMLVFALHASEILGSAAEVADDLLARVLLDGRRTLEPGRQALDVNLLEACSYASPEVGTRALARARELAAARFFAWPSEQFDALATAVAHLLAGETAEIVRPIRPLANSLAFRTLLARLYDAGGSGELAARVDESLMAGDRSFFAGLHMAHVRAARRAARAGQADRARGLASRVIDAWSIADEDVPLLGEMRALAR